MDIIDRLENPETYVDAIDDAINEIKFLRNRISKNEDLEGTIWAIVMKLGGTVEIPYQLMEEAKNKGNSITTWNNSLQMEFIIEASCPTNVQTNETIHVHKLGNGKSRCECGIHFLQVPPRR